MDGASTTFGGAAPADPDALAIEVLEPEDAIGVGAGSDILVVDDDPTNRIAYEAALAPLGRTLVLAESGLDALAKLLEQDVALVLLDVSMPGMNGLETAHAIRERPRNRATPIIFITGMAPTSDLILEAYDAGACDFIVKPVLPEVLRAKVAVYIRLQERSQKLLERTKELRAANEQLANADAQARKSDAIAAAARRLAKLQEATAGLARAKTPGEVAAVAVRLGAEAVDASAATMWLAQSDGSLALAGSHGVPESFLDQWRVIPADAPLPALRVISALRPIWVENEADYRRELPEVFEQARAANRLRAVVTLPLVSDGKGVAVVSYSYDGPHTFSDEERTFLSALMHTCEQALERARLYEAEAEARQVAEALLQRKDELLAMLGHELRNPLAVMSSALELVTLRDGKLNRELSILDRQLKHLAHLVDGLVEVSRIMRGRINLHRGTVDLGDAIREAVEEIGSLTRARDHEVVLNIADNVFVDADRHRLTQVLGNLLNNAATYTPRGGRIEVSAEADGASARITVRDNGRGMQTSLLPQVFDPFVQGERTADRQEGGLGIGLTLVRTIVELHAGTVTAHSDGPGKGSTFIVTWPRLHSKKRAESPRSVVARRVLVVDEHVDAANVLAEVARLFTHEVTVAHHAESAIEIAKDFGPQVVLIDLGLGNVDAWELARQLRLLPNCSTAVLIATTNHHDEAARDRSEREGFAQYLVKPVDFTTLEAALSLSSDDRESPSGDP